ncbi:MAG: phosphate-binding protein [Proteobacteria bacterium]|nr:MAG: phosphate-binding protein [Pseudomonadota bacterium]
MKKISVLLCASLLTTSVYARNQVKIVGSSTIYPFSSAVAEELGAISSFATPVVESTGSGGGMKLFCAGNGLNTPDITNASRPMKKSEFETCVKNGVDDITQAIIGYDGIAFAHERSNSNFNISKKNLALAVAKEVPSKDGKKLIPNPYKKWSDIDKNLPNKKISIYGPPKSSGTRDAFEELVMQSVFKKIPLYTDLYKKDKKKYKQYKKYSIIRTDGVYVESGENDNLIVQKLTKDKNAFGIFGFSFLEENDDIIKGATIDGIQATPKNISSSTYPISRSLFFYIKNSHRNKVSGLNEYIKLFMNEKMIGDEGILRDIGLIALPKSKRDKVREAVLGKVKLKKEDLK